MSEILTVQQLTYKIKNAVETLLPYAWVKGEVTNCSYPKSGHVYFSLKDNDAYLHCVWFKGNQRDNECFDPLTGEVFENGPHRCLAHTLINGQQLVCAGKLSVYPPKGSYQLSIEFAQVEGSGQHHLALEALKNELQQKGYFDLTRKRTIPKNPKNIAVITAPSGAAIQDFLRLSKDRGIKSHIHIYPVPVQGEHAAQCICNAIKDINNTQWAEVIVLIRGGGAYQDLMVFNDRQLVDAIYTSQLPIIAGIGHESDTSFADMTADTRAATPSHVSQMLWTEHTQLIQQIDTIELSLSEYITHQLKQKKQYIKALQQSLIWLSPKRILEYTQLRLSSAQYKLFIGLEHTLKLKKLQLRQCVQYVSNYSILKNILNYTNTINILKENLYGILATKILQKKQQIKITTDNLIHTFYNLYQHQLHQYEKLHLALIALNPTLPLIRGYSLAYLPNGQLLRHVKEAPEDTPLTLQVSDGHLPVIVMKKPTLT